MGSRDGHLVQLGPFQCRRTFSSGSPVAETALQLLTVQAQEQSGLTMLILGYIKRPFHLYREKSVHILYLEFAVLLAADRSGLPPLQPSWMSIGPLSVTNTRISEPVVRGIVLSHGANALSALITRVEYPCELTGGGGSLTDMIGPLTLGPPYVPRVLAQAS